MTQTQPSRPLGPAPCLPTLAFNLRLVVAYEEGLSQARATNAVLAALVEGIEKNIFPLWARARDGDEREICIADFEIFP